MNGKNDTGYTGYEYREITVPKEHASLCLDSYPCFGWEPDPNREADVGRSPKKVSKTLETVALYFRRPRNISNKAELTRLQRNFDSCVAELKALERDKTTPATITALIVGILGTAFMAGATFAAVAEPPIVWLSILLAIPGFLGWIIPFFLYRHMKSAKERVIAPKIEEQHEAIYGICKSGSELLHAGS